MLETILALVIAQSEVVITPHSRPTAYRQTISGDFDNHSELTWLAGEGTARIRYGDRTRVIGTSEPFIAICSPTPPRRCISTSTAPPRAFPRCEPLR
jgi:hypothetical protein